MSHVTSIRLTPFVTRKQMTATFCHVSVDRMSLYGTVVYLFAWGKARLDAKKANVGREKARHWIKKRHFCVIKCLFTHTKVPLFTY